MNAIEQVDINPRESNSWLVCIPIIILSKMIICFVHPIGGRTTSLLDRPAHSPEIHHHSRPHESRAA